MGKNIMKFLNQKTKIKLQFYAVLPAIVIFTFSTLFLCKNIAEAKISSLLSSFIGSERVSAKSQTSTGSSLQTMALLQPSVNSDPSPEKSSDIVPVDNGDSLVADLTDPSGSKSINSQISTYTVQSGDSLSSIAKMFNVSVNTILWANNISRSYNLKPGQTLVILPVTGISYTIKKGDTINGIVSKYKADLQEVLQYNDLTLNSSLIIGQTIVIPDVEMTGSVITSPSSKTNPAHDTNGPDYKGYFIRPVVGGYRSQGIHGYNAIDIADKVGTPIYAAAAGVVLSSIDNNGWNGGYGNFIIITHPNGAKTLYAHNSKNLVRVGEKVEKGQEIAKMGATGKATGSHIHFEIRGAKNPF